MEVNETPEMQEVEDFWSKIWEHIKTHNRDTPWIEDQVKTNEYQEQQKWIDITKEEAALAIMKFSNWKAPCRKR